MSAFDTLGLVFGVIVVLGALVFVTIAFRGLVRLSRNRIQQGHATARDELVGWLNSTGYGLTLCAAYFMGEVLGMSLLAVALSGVSFIWGAIYLNSVRQRIRRMRISREGIQPTQTANTPDH